MNLSGLLALANRIPVYQQLLAALRSVGVERLSPLQLLSAARPYLLAALHADLRQPIVVVVARTDQARQVFLQLRDWSATPEHILLFQEPDALPYERIPWTGDTIRRRITTLATLTAPDPPLIVASARALMQPTLPPRELHLGTRTYRLGQRAPLEKILTYWIGLGYEPASVIQEPGTFSRRGGIVDVFSPQMRHPVRIELFGDEIDSLRTFDPATQRSLERIDEFTLLPATEALPRYGPHAAERLADLDIANLHGPAAAEFRGDRETLTEGGWFKGLEFYLPYLYSRPASLLNHLPENALLFVDDLVDLEATVGDLEAQAVNLRRHAGQAVDGFLEREHVGHPVGEQPRGVVGAHERGEVRASVARARHREGLLHDDRRDVVHVADPVGVGPHLEPGLESLGERQIEEDVDRRLSPLSHDLGHALPDERLVRRIDDGLDLEILPRDADRLARVGAELGFELGAR